LFLTLAVVLVVSASDTSSEPFPTDIVTRSSPLLAITSMLAEQAFLLVFWPAFIVAMTSVVLGRFFCGWACPLGTLFDMVDAILIRLRPGLLKETRLPPSMPGAMVLFAALVVLSLFGYSLSGWFDPLSLLPRTLTVAVLPNIDDYIGPIFGLEGLESSRMGMRQDIPGNVTINTKGGPSHGQLLTALVMGTILLLGIFRRRFYCRYVCPTGALLGLLSRAPLLKRRVDLKTHKACADCRNGCRMGAIAGAEAVTRPSECTLCMSCRKSCSSDSISFRFDGWRSQEGKDTTSREVSGDRRQFLLGTASGVAAGMALEFHARPRTTLPLIRPPGSLPEEEFLELCVRCGACVRTCPTKGLTMLQPRDGILSLWTPVLVSRKGYCIYDCTRCAQVCPSTAIRLLSAADRKRSVIGIAELDRNRCLPWIGESSCSICFKICPVHPNAIELVGEEQKRPVVVDSRCVGCGICEYVCPVGGDAAIKIKEARDF